MHEDGARDQIIAKEASCTRNQIRITIDLPYLSKGSMFERLIEIEKLPTTREIRGDT